MAASPRNPQPQAAAVCSWSNLHTVWGEPGWAKDTVLQIVKNLCSDCEALSRGADKEMGTPIVIPHVVLLQAPLLPGVRQSRREQRRRGLQELSRQNPGTCNSRVKSRERQSCLWPGVTDTSCPPFLQTLWGTPNTADFWAPRTPRVPAAPSGGWWLKSCGSTARQVF